MIGWIKARLPLTPTLIPIALGFVLGSTAQGQAPNAADAITARTRNSDLMRSVPFDRITLIDNTVIEVEPVQPRPLPVPDTKKSGKTQLELQEMAKKDEERVRNRRLGRIDENDPEDTVVIHLLDGEPRDFKTRRTSIKSIEYFEDLLIAEADRLIASSDFAKAFERQLLVKVRDPNWKGLDDAVNRLPR